MSHHFSRPLEPLVEKNPFRVRRDAPVRVPDFAAVRPYLPQPVLPEDPGWVALYWAAWESLWSRLHPSAQPGCLPSVFVRPTAGANLEMGASAFIAQVAGYAAGAFDLIGTLDNFYACQHDDGFIGRELDPTTGAEIHSPFEPNSTGPNLLSWAEWRHFRLTGDRERVAAVFWPLMSYHRWCRAHRRWPNGLYWATGYSSGLVNQPRVPGARYHHLHWSWVDASAQAALDCDLLSRMALLLEEQALADELLAEQATLQRAINDHLWNEDVRFYQDAGPNGQFSAVKSIAAYWTLLDSQTVTEARMAPFLQHLRDTWAFRIEHCLPSMSADSEGYNARTGNGWRGAVWPSLTYMVLRGLLAVNQAGLAHKLAVNHVDTVAELWQESGTFWASYAPEEAEPGEPAEPDEGGLTTSAVAAMVLENLLGVAIDYPLRRVTWHRHLDRREPYGVRGMPLGRDGVFDLLGDREAVHVRTDAPFTLVVHAGQEVVQMAVPAGEVTIPFN